ncbi:MAG: transposase family protein [bacterium]
MNTRRIVKDNRQLKAVIGMGREEFVALLPAFAEAWHVELRLASPHRVRRIGGGKKGALKTMEDKLFAVLLYLKTYPTFDVLGFLTDRDRTRACRSTHFLLSVLGRALGKKLAMPERRIASVEEFFEKFPETKDVFLDGTERPVQRPKDARRRKKLYSGKKKRFTRKTIVVADEKKRILILTPTRSGRRHDKRLTDKSGLADVVPDSVAIFADTGLQGMQRDHASTLIPKKTTRNNPLTEADKQNNRIISGLRIVVEHAIGGMKRFKAAADIYRNRIPNTDDLFHLLSAGLWNFHLQQTT